MDKLILCWLTVLSAHALESFVEQTPLTMTPPNTTKNTSVKWIPLSTNGQEVSAQNTKPSNKSIDESIKNQIQKKMQALLKPLKEDEDER